MRNLLGSVDFSANFLKSKVDCTIFVHSPFPWWFLDAKRKRREASKFSQMAINLKVGATNGPGGGEGGIALRLPLLTFSSLSLSKCSLRLPAATNITLGNIVMFFFFVSWTAIFGVYYVDGVCGGEGRDWR